MSMNETLIANLTEDELTHYAGLDPSIVKAMGHDQFIGKMTGEFLDLQDDIKSLEHQVATLEEQQDENICKPLYYHTWQEVYSSVEGVAQSMGTWLEDQPLADDHPLKTMFENLCDASDRVRKLYHGG